MLIYGVAFCILTAVSLLRQSGEPPTNTVWAEDGAIFYSQALNHSFFGALFTPYNGYLQLFPRLVFAPLAALPPADLAATAAVVGAASLAGLALFVFHAARGVIPSVVGRSLVVGTMALLPLASGELLNNVVNVPWWLFFAAFWALLWRPRTPVGSVLAGLVCLLAVGSDPLVGLLVPLALVRIFALGWKEEAAPLGLGLGLGLVYQVIGAFQPGHQSAFTNASTYGVPQAVGDRLGLGWIGGARISDYFVTSSNWFWPVLGALLLVAVLAVAVVLRQRRLLVFVITALSFSVLLLAVPVSVRGVGAAMVGRNVFYAGRYVATPILLVWSAVIAEATSVPSETRLARHIGVVLCCACLIPVWVVDFRTANGRSDGPPWGGEVAHARVACRGRSAGTEVLKISPLGWSAVVPCSDL